jgi:ribose transport system permease protein
MSQSSQANSASKFRALGVIPAEAGPIIAMFVVIAVFAILDAIWGTGNYLSLRNIRIFLQESAMIGVPALGMTAIIIAGGIDLSAGAAIALCGTLLAMVLDVCPASLVIFFGEIRWIIPVSPVVLAIIAALATGAACGLVNGGLIVSLRVIPFVVTLGTMTIFVGLARIGVNSVTSGSHVSPSRDEVPQWLAKMCSTAAPHEILAGVWFPRLTPPVWICLALAVVMWILLNRTVLGRHIYAVGSNEATARICGISPARVKLIVYMLAGVLIGVGGILNFADTKLGNPMGGAGLELEIIAAAVIGGASLSGGRGSIAGTLAGAVIMKSMRSGLVQLDVADYYQQLFIGGITIAAVTIDQLRRRRED